MLGKLRDACRTSGRMPDLGSHVGSRVLCRLLKYVVDPRPCHPSPALFFPYAQLTPGSPSAHPTPALVARAHGSLTLSPVEGELNADFCLLGDIIF
jgi:hypothetical protein